MKRERDYPEPMPLFDSLDDIPPLTLAAAIAALFGWFLLLAAVAALCLLFLGVTP